MRFTRRTLLVIMVLTMVHLTSFCPCFGQDDNRVFERTGEVVSADTLRRLMEEGYAIRLDSCTIQGRWVCKQGRYSELRMSQCIVTDSVDLEQARFHDSVIIRNCEFRQSVHLKGVVFLGSVRFDSTKFQFGVNLAGTRFRDSAFFAHTVFSNSAVFSGTHFDGLTYFEHAVFKGIANFSLAVFADTLWTTFSESRFNGRANFIFSKFPLGADFMFARFTGGADFGGAEFTGLANFFRATFEGSHSLTGIGEPGVVMGWVVGSASFIKATFDSVCFALANLDGVILERSRLSEFSMKCLAQADGLAGLQYFSYPDMLANLREYFREKHYRQQEREITCALERHNQLFIKKLLFDWPFEYGSNLERPFMIVFCFMFPVCSAYYFLTFLFRKKSGLFVNEAWFNPTTNNNERNTFRVWPKDVSIPKIAWNAIFFSLISIFNLSFRDMDFARWLRRILRKKTDYEPFGWVRTISSLQAIFSILLMAFGLLFYFGRFFD